MNDRKIAFLATGGAAGLGGTSALLASCCAAPWAVALFGTATAAALARFSYLYPYLLVAVALSVGGVFWLAYRRRPVDCPEAGQSVDRQLRLLAWSLAAALAALVLAIRNLVA